jgi:hypothetical protein
MNKDQESDAFAEKRKTETAWVDGKGLVEFLCFFDVRCPQCRKRPLR